MEIPLNEEYALVGDAREFGVAKRMMGKRDRDDPEGRWKKKAKQRIGWSAFADATAETWIYGWSSRSLGLWVGAKLRGRKGGAPWFGEVRMRTLADCSIVAGTETRPVYEARTVALDDLERRMMELVDTRLAPDWEEVSGPAYWARSWLHEEGEELR